ncbi:RNA polymerase sigma factor [Paenibacillus sp. 1P03SA]|uniref:RNA polymerase sigma factor n=1 Tax=Paenibacillus sp. 1P03SA TaxID=3132294 RepID=UPI0039A38CA6
MTKQLNNELINELSVRYASTGSDEILAQLLDEVRPMIYNEAVRAERKYDIPREDMVSEFTQDIWEAVRGEAAANFDGSSNFTQRFHTFFKRSLVNHLRYRKAAKRDIPTYSLDRAFETCYQIDTDEGSFTPQWSGHGTVPSQENVVEEEVLLDEWINETLAGFRTSHERQCKVIELTIFGCTNIEIANALGSPTYDESTRQFVSRAKKSFQKYVNSQNPLSA